VSAQTGGTTVNGITIPTVVNVNGKSLKINGAGVREKTFLDLYVGALYLMSKTTNAKEVIDSDSTMAIKLRIISNVVNRENMKEAFRSGFKKSTSDSTEIFKSKVIEFITKGFADEIEKGDEIDIEYIPGKGTHLKRNGKTLVTIKGMEFKQAVFGFWLCEEPVDANLKKKMLGK